MIHGDTPKSPATYGFVEQAIQDLKQLDSKKDPPKVEIANLGNINPIPIQETANEENGLHWFSRNYSGIPRFRYRMNPSESAMIGTREARLDFLSRMLANFDNSVWTRSDFYQWASQNQSNSGLIINMLFNSGILEYAKAEDNILMINPEFD